MALDFTLLDRACAHLGATLDSACLTIPEIEGPLDPTDLPAFRTLASIDLAPLDDLEESIERLLQLPNEVQAAAETLGAAVKALQGRMESFGELHDDYEEFVVALQVQTEVLVEQIESIADAVVSEFPSQLAELGRNITSAFDEDLAAVSRDILLRFEREFLEALSDCQALTRSVVGDAISISDDLSRDFKSKVIDMVEREVTETATDVAKDVVEGTLSEIVEGMTVSQLSAQITAALSAQVPQLIAAKQAVKAVKRLLDIMRKGI